MELIAFNIPLFVKLLVALVLGGALGLERSVAGKTAGMRTFALVSLGAALFVITATSVTQVMGPLGAIDPLRVAASIVSGIGFLGAGLIIFADEKVRGLTTAAGLWVAAGIGAATGFGLYALAVFTTILTLLTFTVLWYVEHRIADRAKAKKMSAEDDDV